MEGLLWKWTNYWSGWQPRWFILDSGILSYYNSQDEVGKGCRGSIKMSVCDVMVDQADVTRFELNIPGEQRFFLKASNSKERQQWVVALGSCKAALQTAVDPTYYLSTTDYSKLHGNLKQKKNELRIFCDLLMQKVHAIKEASLAEPIDVQKMEENTMLLGDTCDTFIHTLEECMRLIDKPTKPITPDKDVIPALNPSSPVNPAMKHLSRSPSIERQPLKSILRKPQRSVSQSSTDTDQEHSVAHLPKQIQHRPLQEETSNGSLKNISADTVTQDVNTSTGKNNNDIKTVDHNAGLPKPELSSSSYVVTDVFTTMGTSFISMTDSINDGINTKNYLAAAFEVTKIFDKLSSAAFAPVKSDVIGNIKKIEQKWTMDPKSLSSLQKLVDYEISNKQHLDPNSATQALLWLTRGLLFIAFILDEIPKQASLINAVSIAYEKTLKPFHNFVVRGVVSIAMRACPYKENFLHSLIEDADLDPTDENVMSSLLDHMLKYQQSLQLVCHPLIQFYKDRNMILINDTTNS